MILFSGDSTWIKNNSKFDVTIGPYDRVEICELVGLRQAFAFIPI